MRRGRVLQLVPGYAPNFFGAGNWNRESIQCVVTFMLFLSSFSWARIVLRLGYICNGNLISEQNRVLKTFLLRALQVPGTADPWKESV